MCICARAQSTTTRISTTQNGTSSKHHHVTSPATANYYATQRPTSAATSSDLMVMRQNRHQRDLFTGSLGIPDVSTHVGSVIHAFESLASQRADQLLLSNQDGVGAAEQPYETGGHFSFNNGRNLRNDTIRSDLVDDVVDDDEVISGGGGLGVVGNRHTLPSFHRLVDAGGTSYAPQPHYNYLPNEYHAGGSTVSVTNNDPISRYDCA